MIWGRVSVRVSDHELHAARIDGIGADWPISYADLAPHYDHLERFLGVVGTAEGDSNLPDGVCSRAPSR